MNHFGNSPELVIEWLSLVWNQSSGVPFKKDREKIMQDSSSGKSFKHAKIYIKHWKTKVSLWEI
jgi:hypothetical protein